MILLAPTTSNAAVQLCMHCMAWKKKKAPEPEEEEGAESSEKSEPLKDEKIDELVTAVKLDLPGYGSADITSEARIAPAENGSAAGKVLSMKLTLGDSQEKTLMKLVVDAQSDLVLGCHMVGPEAGEIIQGLAVALKAGATKRVFDETLGIHPSSAEEFVTMRVAVSA